jgi:cell wall-associated NlpC family hydrolase
MTMIKTTQPAWVTDDIVRAAQAHAMREFPKEACGLVTKSKGYVPCENVHPDPINYFMMNPSDWIENPDTVGLLHSHTNGNYAPGADDMESQIATGCAWGIIVATADSASTPLWWGGDTPQAPLLGRQFIHGIYDCYALIRDWYQQERGVTLKDYPRDNMWWEKPGEALYNNFQDAGFYQIPTDPTGIAVGDVFIMKVRSAVENHGGLYVGNGLILHHVGGHLSLTSPASQWMRLVTRWVRYGAK